MDVILLEKIGKLGELGDQVTVKAGYGRNFLIPFGKAVPATKENIKEFEERRAELEAAAAEKMATAQARAEKLEGLKVSIEANAGEEGKLFGSVGTQEISDAVIAAGVDIEKSQVSMPEGPIRVLGEYSIDIQLHGDITSTITVIVVPQ